MSDDEIKVTDRRMFTPEGELREEFRYLEEEPAVEEPEGEPRPEDTGPSPTPAAAEPRPSAGASREPSASPDAEAPPLELPTSSAGPKPSFFDLVALLAEPVPIYLGDQPLPDGRSGEHLEMAKLHIDLLDVVRVKSVGNLTAQENAFLEDVLYRLRLAYVQKRG